MTLRSTRVLTRRRNDLSIFVIDDQRRYDLRGHTLSLLLHLRQQIVHTHEKVLGQRARVCVVVSV